MRQIEKLLAHVLSMFWRRIFQNYGSSFRELCSIAFETSSSVKKGDTPWIISA